MAEHNANQGSPISDSLHPLVNMAIIGLVSMFVAAVWMFFDSDPYGAWLDVVVTGLFVIAIAIPTICWLTWQRNADGARLRAALVHRARSSSLGTRSCYASCAPRAPSPRPCTRRAASRCCTPRSTTQITHDARARVRASAAPSCQSSPRTHRLLRCLVSDLRVAPPPPIGLGAP